MHSGRRTNLMAKALAVVKWLQVFVTSKAVVQGNAVLNNRVGIPIWSRLVSSRTVNPVFVERNPLVDTQPPHPQITDSKRDRKAGKRRTSAVFERPAGLECEESIPP